VSYVQHSMELHDAARALVTRAVDSARFLITHSEEEAMVGHWPVAFKTIDRLSRNGKIHGERSRVKFEQKLRSFLRRTGYL